VPQPCSFETKFTCRAIGPYRWHDGTVTSLPTRTIRRLLVGLALAFGVLVGPSTIGAVHASAPPVTPDPASIGTNPFIPEDVNIGDCVSSVPRPDCGTEEHGGAGQYLTMLALVLGTAFIGWRIARGVRARDSALDPAKQPLDPAKQPLDPSSDTAPAER
jgi:hypothetical protein